VHILFYFAIGAAMFLDYFLENHKFSFNRKNLLVFLLFPLIYGAIIEVIQGFLPHRTAEWLDLLSDFIGGLLATVFFYFFRKKITFFLINHINIVHRIG
jgi:VanZ family protein